MKCFFFLLLAFSGSSDALLIDGCPLFGCRPSGSFSFYLQTPLRNATINWVSDFALDAVPSPLGCVADSVNIVCQSNGAFSVDMGLVSLYGQNGTIRWRDRVLHYPPLPMLDNYGDVTASDGVSLVHYDLFGKLFPVIKCYSLRPMFSMQLVSTIYLLLVSEQGGLIVRDTQAIPVASIFLNDTIQRTNGTFLPIAQPVVHGFRFYLLTEFVPESDTFDPSILGLQRLYAIDIHHRMADIITIAWFYNFEMEAPSGSPDAGLLDDTLRFKPRDEASGMIDDVPDSHVHVHRDEVVSRLWESVTSKQNLIIDTSTQTFYVSLPPPYMATNKADDPSGNSVSTFWGFRDSNDTVQHLFRSDDLDVAHMATFEANDDAADGSVDARNIGKHGTTAVPAPVWIATVDSMLHVITPTGNISRTINMKSLLNADVTITTRISLTRVNDTTQSILVLGIKIQARTERFSDFAHSLGVQDNGTSYVVAIATESVDGEVLWMVPVPGDLEVRGQISGSPGADLQLKDQLIFYAEEAGKHAKIMSIH